MAAVTERTAPRSQPVTLYDLSQGLAGVEAFIDEHQDEIIAAGGNLDAVPGLLEQLEALEGSFIEKVERVALFIQNRAALATARRAESDRFKRLADADYKVVDSLKTYLCRCQRIAGKPKVETPHVRASVQRNSQQSIERAAAAPALPTLYVQVSEADTGDTFEQQIAAGVLQCIVAEPQPTLYSLNRERILEIWKARYEEAKLNLELEASTAHAEDGRGMTEYELDRQSQLVANADPVLRALGVTVSQGYHVRLR
jgi:hypothetical protein